MKTLLVVFYLTILVSANDDDWEAYKAVHNKVYETRAKEEAAKRAFHHSLALVAAQNLDERVTSPRFRMGLNKFADMSQSEFNKLMTGLRVMPTNLSDKTTDTLSTTLRKEVPAHLDWRDKGYVTPVKNQGSCASCWAFSVTGALESHYFKKTGQLISVSEQQLIDCAPASTTPTNCPRGWMENGFSYVRDAGIHSEDVYPFTAKKTTCPKNSTLSPVFKSKGLIRLPFGSEAALLNAVATNGPVSVAFDATQPTFKLYEAGIYDDPKCADRLNHAVLVVGYGVENGVPYWLVKNSWGDDWGENGYFRVIRNANNKCSIASYGFIPTF